MMAPSEAARALGVSSATVRLWLAEGKLTGEMTALGRLIDAASVARLAAKRAERAATAGR